VAAWLAGLAHRAAFNARFLQVAVMAATTFVYHLIYLGVLATTSYTADWATLTRLLGPALALNILLLLLFYRPLAWFNRRPPSVGMNW
jgi:hypothetical protein